MRLLQLTFAMAAALLVATPIVAQPDEDEVQWLMVVQGEVTGIDDNRMMLATAPSAIVFTDRPERRVGIVGLAGFSEAAWSAGGAFASDPPNASLIDETSGAIAIVTINGMNYEAGTLTLGVALLSGDLPEAGAHVALTIDAIEVDGQITDAVTQANVKVLGDAPAEAMGEIFQP